MKPSMAIFLVGLVLVPNSAKDCQVADEASMLQLKDVAVVKGVVEEKVVVKGAIWKLAGVGKNCVETCDGQCDLVKMKEFTAKRMSDTSVVDTAWADAAGFSGHCKKATHMGRFKVAPGIYGKDDCRTYTDLAGWESNINCESSSPSDLYRRMCACPPPTWKPPIRKPPIWKLAGVGKNCVETCGGQCDLVKMKEFSEKRMSDTSVVDEAWADAAGFSGHCKKATHMGRFQVAPGIYGKDDCRTYTDLAGWESNINCESSSPSDLYRRMCACPPPIWKLAGVGKNCVETCGGPCDLVKMKEFAAKRMSNTSVVDKAWADAAGFSGQCNQARNTGSIKVAPGIYGEDDCRTYTDDAGQESNIDCESINDHPGNTFKRMCACPGS